MNGTYKEKARSLLSSLAARVIYYRTSRVLGSAYNKIIAGSAPLLQACNDNDYRAGAKKTYTEGPPTDAFKVRGYCCRDQTHGCFLYQDDAGTIGIWCRSRKEWTKTACGDYPPCKHRT